MSGPPDPGLPDGQAPRLVYVPAVPDGPDRPWTRGRRTRWWLVVPADLVAVTVAVALAAASSKTLAGTPAGWWSQLWGPLAGLALGWLLALVIARGDDHLEVAGPGALVTVSAWAGWSASRAWAGRVVDVDWAVMSLVLLAVALLGWRVLYGYAKAHDSMVPKPVQRRLDAQAGRGRED
ncbi:MAG: DUF3054 family protein [Actinomyces sp.]|uniref:DUF3054 family protein n=1 Tax=Actinomyces sp. TaxID=29317 RepID=UPI0026DC566F|nr:DUF3054 family protein [Actinomyces sp.]MDO4243381.1 DUF3054 family protein [Actinomyces sp.]